MATYTALSLVNRVLRALRLGEASTLTDPKAAVMLDYLNAAKDYILETRDWNFMHRSDGVLITQAQVSLPAPGSAFSNGGVNAQIGNFTCGDYVGRVLVTTDANFSDVAYRLKWNINGTGNATMETGWIGTTDGVAGSLVVFYEYCLPDTVKDVISVRSQDRDLTLTPIDMEQFKRMVPRPWDRISDTPELVAVGGQIRPTTDPVIYPVGTYPNGRDPMLGLVIYPTPETSYRLEYDYTYRHPQLSSTQGLEFVPDFVVHDIVQEAIAYAFAGMQNNDPSLFDANHKLAEIRSARFYQANRADESRRNELRSLDSKGSSRRLGHDPADWDVFN